MSLTENLPEVFKKTCTRCGKEYNTEYEHAAYCQKCLSSVLTEAEGIKPVDQTEIDIPKKKNQFLKAVEEMKPLSEVNQLYIEYIYEVNQRNKVHTARALGCDRRSLQRWLKGEKK